jgi:hypothetical protein
MADHIDGPLYYGRGVAAALALGADGVWVGSRMVATRESAVHPEHKRRIVAASGEQTVRCSIFGPEWPDFNPMRVIRNRVVEEWNDRLSEVPTRRDDLPEIGRTRFLGQDMVMRKFNVILATEDTEGDSEEMPWLGGALKYSSRPMADFAKARPVDLCAECPNFISGRLPRCVSIFT